MAKLINWKRNWLNSKFELFVDGMQKGAIIFNSWKNEAESNFEHQDYTFKCVGFWRPKTNVFDKKTNELVAVISYDNWKTRAVIHLNSGEQFEWKPTNFWKSQFSVSNHIDTNIVYSPLSNTGSISSDTDNSLIIIAGLFIKQVYNKRGMTLVACFVPIMIAATSRHNH
ncbi:hypothetical protein DHW03_02020 [Pedobacter yonginense]|uniref:Uncharacterized protein n=1 Tax=Pedobacter yonginense TaxID=651869 RepID=A0A317ER97_9SPHI|nr:hypothetical protein [Pedobacter yonginense]PWS28647.1 hypothetical protein DHW03_02020 [Pedobacter yonginense]